MIDFRKIASYLSELTDKHNNINSKSMITLRKAIQKGVFSNDELLFLRRYMIKKKSIRNMTKNF